MTFDAQAKKCYDTSQKHRPLKVIQLFFNIKVEQKAAKNSPKGITDWREDRKLIAYARREPHFYAYLHLKSERKC